MTDQDSDKSEKMLGGSAVHQYTAAGMIALSVLISPFSYDALREVYPLGELSFIYDTCEEEDKSFNRWDEGERALCLLMSGQ